MDSDALAAVVAAAQLLLAGTETEKSAQAAPWLVAGRVRTLDAEGIRQLARFRSRWAMMGRLQC
jgi:LDH2 family malate/lactate/ureidoglycolate dehydrogenase